MQTNKIFIFITLVILVIFGIYAFKNKAVAPTTQTAPQFTTIATYTCIEGPLIATYTASQVSLKLLNGQTLSLPQVISGSGTRYEANGTVLVTKGDNAFLQENGVTTYSNCLANGTVPTNNGTTQTFIDSGKTFSFIYPKNLSVTGGELGYPTNWRNNVSTLGLILATVAIPRDTQPKTNFSQATFTVGTSGDPQAVKDCLIATNGEIAKESISINGVVYKKFILSDAAVGNRYDTTSYRTMKNDQCYVIEYVIHSTAIGNYDPNQGITQFDITSVTAILESMVQSFKFL